MNRSKILLVMMLAAATGLVAVPRLTRGQSEAPGTLPPGTVKPPRSGAAELEPEKLPPFDMGKFCYALGLDAARKAKEQKTAIEEAELRKGIEDGLGGTGPSPSYSYGISLGRRLKEFGVEPDLDQYFAGVADVVAGREPKVDEREAAIQISLFEREQLKKREEMHMAQGKAFLEKNILRPEVKENDTGWGKIQYRVLSETRPDGPKPKPGDRILIHYKGLLLDETEWRQFTSSEGGEPLEVIVGQGLIRGLELGVQMMSVGAKYRFFFPPELGFGREGPAGIPPNAVLLFDVEVLGFAEGKPSGLDFPGLRTPVPGS